MTKLSDFPLPLLGFVAYSGIGKTSLLRQLIPLLLKDHGIRVALIKHSHHDFEIDYPGKDSYELRKAGVEQVVIASKYRTAFIKENTRDEHCPNLLETLNLLQLKELDLVLVEGFKRETFNKIELHRACLRKDYIYLNDDNVIAVASDQISQIDRAGVASLNINDIYQVKNFVVDWYRQQTKV